MSTPTPKKTVKLAMVVNAMKHQKTVMDFIVRSDARGLIVFQGVGSGKTITALLSAQEILKTYPDKHVIIATPASLVSNFENTIDKLQLPFREKIKVESYQKLSNFFKKKGYTVCLNAVLIIDESHNFNGGGMMFEAMFNCASRAFKVILLSATIVKNSPGELAKQLSLVEGKRVSGVAIDKISAVKDEKKRRKLFKAFFECKISFYKTEDIVNYPKVTEHVVMLPMSQKYYNEYYSIQEDVRANLPEYLEDTSNITVFYNGIRRASNKTNVLSPKIKWIAEKIVKDYNAGKKILIYSNWIDTGIVILKQILEAEDIKFSQVIGGLSKKEKDKNISLYNSGKTRIMLVSASGSEGLNLKETRTVIIMEPYWNKTRVEQVIGRAARYKSHINLPEKDRKVDAYHLILDKPKDKYKHDKLDSADVMIWDMAEKKQQFIDAFYDTLRQVSIENDKSCTA